MEQEKREILRSARVELVDNINIQDGLYTQMLTRNIFNSRTVSRIRLNRPPEQQIEELLNELPKKDCFETFCEALIADGQEHIVKKYLKPPTVVASGTPTTAAPPPLPPSTSSDASTPNITPSTSVTVNPTSPLKRSAPSNTTGAVICIRESDNGHLIIRYVDDGTPPEKQLRPADCENGQLHCEEDETRYALKHFVTDPNLHNSILRQPSVVTVMDNPQVTYCNPNISDPSRYAAAFASQRSNEQAIRADTQGNSLKDARLMIPPSMSSPLKEPSSIINEQNIRMLKETTHIKNLLRPDVTNPHCHTNSVSERSFIRLTPSMAIHEETATPFSSSSLHKYLDRLEFLSPSKKPSPAMSNSPPTHDPGFLAQAPYDSVETVKVMTTLRNSKGQCDMSFTNVVQAADFANPSLILPAAPADTIDAHLPSTFSVYHQKQGLYSDLEEIDLLDGCVNVNVEHCTREFFMNNYKKAYPMRRIPRGLALIINVDEVVGKPARKGTNFDRDNLVNLLRQLHFNVIVFNDNDGLSAQEMVNKLTDFANRNDHYDADACFICLLSHGEEQYIFGTDGKRIPLDEVFMLFDNTHCKGLMGKPKIFIIQACRGGTFDRGVRMDEPDGGPVPPKPYYQLPSMSDMLICYPTLMGYYAWRNRARGSWYIEAIVQVFMRHAKNEDICAMLNRVNLLVSRKVSECNQKEMNQMSQMSEYKSTLRQPHLFLFPGIGCTINQNTQPSC